MKDLWNNLPTGITEDDLLGLVEGDLGETRAHQARAALRGHPGGKELLRRLDAMRADRTTLAAFEPVRAPAGLVASAEALAERELLAGDIVEPEVMNLRVSSVQPHRRPGVLASLGELLSSRGLARQLAVAAGFLIAAGGLLWGVAAIVSEIDQPVRIAGEEIPEPAPEGAAPANERRLAVIDGPGEPVDATEPGEVALATGPAAEPGPLEGPDDPFLVDHVMDGERALALAREGRLAVRVRVGSPDLALASIENVRRVSQRQGVIWRTLPGSVSGPMYVAMADAASRPLASPEASAPAVAGNEGGPRPLTGEEKRPLELPQPVGVLSAAYELQISGSATMLESLRRALTRGRFQVAEFVELPEPVETEPSLDPRAMFWWDEPPARWEKRIRVPVLVEAVE